MKKFFGYVLLVIGILFSVLFALYLVGNIPQIMGLIRSGGSYNFGYLAGKLFFDAIVIALILLMIKTGMKWTRKKKPVAFTTEAHQDNL